LYGQINEYIPPCHRLDLNRAWTKKNKAAVLEALFSEGAMSYRHNTTGFPVGDFVEFELYSWGLLAGYLMDPCHQICRFDELTDSQFVQWNLLFPHLKTPISSLRALYNVAVYGRPMHSHAVCFAHFDWSDNFAKRFLNVLTKTQICQSLAYYQNLNPLTGGYDSQNVNPWTCVDDHQS